MDIYKLYDSTGVCFVDLEGYDAYLEYFLNVLRPLGKGTRYVYSKPRRLGHSIEYGMLVINHA